MWFCCFTHGPARVATVHTTNDATVREWGGVDLLFVNAGGPPAGTLLSFDDAAVQGAFELLALSALRMVRRAVPSMRARGGGVTGAPTVTGPTAVYVGSTADNVTAVGQSVFTTYLFAFEATAALLIIAVVGAVVLARRERSVEGGDLV